LKAIKKRLTGCCLLQALGCLLAQQHWLEGEQAVLEMLLLAIGPAAAAAAVV
jgi:hypothetical protein